MREVAILGSTGSIGRQGLDVIASNRERLRVCALAANQNIELLAQQANQFQPAILSVGRLELEAPLRSLLSYEPAEVTHADRGLHAVALESGAEVVLAAMDGMQALHAVAATLERGLQLALANKELLDRKS